MKAKTIFLAILAISGFVYACYCRDGISWFPGFFVCVAAINGIFDSLHKDKEDTSHV